jgi:site-specific DNA-methyltransferase (cytosine-N4-specific)
MTRIKQAYRTKYGICYQASVEDILKSKIFQKYKGRINLIFTSPPFPLNRKKKYGNRNGNEYIKWLTDITTSLRDYLTDDGSLVIEIGNSWETNEPVMSTFPIETLLAIKKKGSYKLCQQFIWFNTAKLPSPVQWVNIERIRVKDSFTNIWWLSKSSTPKANNRNILEEYSDSMKKLLQTKKYNSGLRPSEHNIGEESFLTNNGGAIPSNVLIAANTLSNSPYLSYCKEHGLTPHPARMPHFIAEYFIKFLTNENDLVFDPFAGSNTTGEVCETLKRKWVVVEVEQNYVVGSKVKFNHAT